MGPLSLCVVGRRIGRFLVGDWQRGQCHNGPTGRKPQSFRLCDFFGSTVALRRYFTARPPIAAKNLFVSAPLAAFSFGMSSVRPMPPPWSP